MVNESELRDVPELGLSPLLPLNASGIQLRNRQGDLVVDVLVQYTHQNDRQRSEGQIEPDNIAIIEDILAVIVGKDLIPEKPKRPNNVLTQQVSKTIST